MRQLTIPALVLFLIASACGGSQTKEDEPITAASAAVGHLETTENGTLRVVGDDTIAAGDIIRIVPADWPADVSGRPTLGFGTIREGNDDATAVIWSIRQTAGIEGLLVEQAESIEPLGESKLLTVVERTNGSDVWLPLGNDMGVSEGDFYFILNRAFDPDRLGSNIGALVVVEEVGESIARARIEHSDVDIEAGQLALFAQASLNRPNVEGTVLVAPMVREESNASPGLPEIALALPDYLSRYGISNIGVRRFDRFVDPVPYDAPHTAEEMAPEDGYGAFVFGEVFDDQLIFNTTTFGIEPQSANTVGILPGGLPIPFDTDVAELSVQLAPSFICTVLAQRGDHALAIYFLESVLQNVELNENVRFHLREHLALRYGSLGLNGEALRIITTDVERAREEALTYPLLNALSIRSYLDSRAGLYDQWVEDTREFIEVADGVLPWESLGYERLNHARALIRSDATEPGIEELRALSDFARETEDKWLSFAVLMDLVGALLSEDEVSAQLVMRELTDIGTELDRTAQVAIAISGAEVFVLVDEPLEAMEYLETAFREAEQSADPPLQANVYRRGAFVLRELGMPDEAWRTLEQAAALLIETGQFDSAATVMQELGYAQLERANQLGGQESVGLFIEGRHNLMLGSELALRLGNTLEAARSMVIVGLIDTRFGNGAGGKELIRTATDLAFRSAHYTTLYEIYEQLTQLEIQEGNYDRAEEYRDQAELWSEAAGLDVTMPEIIAPTL